ncbi:MAG TPA: hypothetical protein DCW90_09085 [Lachnospiraceae bacterium]|nr:hypothetical protein [Lachnospiraceae bacterium]
MMKPEIRSENSKSIVLIYDLLNSDLYLKQFLLDALFVKGVNIAKEFKIQDINNILKYLRSGFPWESRSLLYVYDNLDFELSEQYTNFQVLKNFVSEHDSYNLSVELITDAINKAQQYKLFE